MGSKDTGENKNKRTSELNRCIKKLYYKLMLKIHPDKIKNIKELDKKRFENILNFYINKDIINLIDYADYYKIDYSDIINEQNLITILITEKETLIININNLTQNINQLENYLKNNK